MSYLTLMIENDPLIKKVELISECVRELCSLTPLEPDIIESINLCVVEGVNNVVEHSYANRLGEQVHVKVELQSDRIVVDIIDTGIGLKDGKLPEATLHEFDPEDIDNLPEGGWGLFIMTDVMDEVDYFQEAGTNTLRLCKLF